MKKNTFKENFITFIGELTAGLILVFAITIFLIAGLIVVCLFPEKVFTIFAEMIELVILIGFFTILLLLYAISKIIEIIHTIKEKYSNHNSMMETPPDGE